MLSINIINAIANTCIIRFIIISVSDVIRILNICIINILSIHNSSCITTPPSALARRTASGERSEEADDGGGSNVEEDLLPILGLIRQTEIALFREARQVRVCLGLLVSACLWEGRSGLIRSSNSFAPKMLN